MKMIFYLCFMVMGFEGCIFMFLVFCIFRRSSHTILFPFLLLCMRILSGGLLTSVVSGGALFCPRDLKRTRCLYIPERYCTGCLRVSGS